jgi:hypothetical protein
MLCYLRVAGATQVNSDGAGLVLEAQSLLHGNLLLHGWWATDVSFYTTELPEYVLVSAFGGVRPEVVHICSALTYTLLVLLAAYVARGRERGAAGVARALVAAGVMLAPQPTGPTQVLLGSPDHVGTGVPVLLLLLLLDWARGGSERRRWYVPVAAGVLLAWSIVGDPLIEVVGAAPLFLASVTRAARLTRRRWPSSPVPWPSASPDRLARAWAAARSAAFYELGLAAAAVLAVPAAGAANWFLRQLGGYRTGSAFYGLQSPYQVLHGLPVAGRSVLALFGADPWSVHGGGSVAFALVHLAGVAVVLAGVLLALWRLARPRCGQADLVADIAVLAIVANLAAFVVGVPKPNIYAAHEIGPVLALGAVLAGRLVGGRVVAEWPRPLGERWHSGFIAALAAGLAGYAALLGLAAAHPQAPPRNVALAAWLTEHHLRSGLAPYWEASSVTVDAGGAVSLLAVTPGPRHLLVPQRWQTYTRLSDAPVANFVITSPAESVHRQEVINTFGRPPHTYYVGPYTVYVWPKNLLPQLEQARDTARAVGY